MKKALSEDLLETILEHIRASPGQLSAGDFDIDRAKALLAIRTLRRRGLIEGNFLDDTRQPPDRDGRLLYDATGLVAL